MDWYILLVAIRVESVVGVKIDNKTRDIDNNCHESNNRLRGIHFLLDCLFMMVMFLDEALDVRRDSIGIQLMNQMWVWN